MNNKYRKRTSLILAVLLVFTMLFAACGTSSQYPQYKEGSEEEDRLFVEFIDQVFLDDVAAETIGLHYTLAYPENFSIINYPVTFGGIGEQSRKDELIKAQSRKDTLLSFDYDELAQKNKQTYDVFMWSIDAELSSEAFDYYDEYLSPLIGIQAEYPILLAEYTFRTERDVTDYLELLTQLDEFYGEIVVYEQEKSAAGLFMADYTLDAIIKQCSDLIEDRENHFLISTFDSRIDPLDFLTEEEKAGYKEANIAALNDDVFPAYELLIAGLDELRGTGTNDQGLCYYPLGKEYYAYLAKVFSGSDRTVPELIDLTLDQMDSYISDMRALFSQSQDLFERYESAIASLEKAEPTAILEKLRHDILEHYPAPPDVNYTVKYVDPAMEEHLSPGFYLTPPLDMLTENSIYINLAKSDPDDAEYTFSLMAHEGYPGHLYQTVYTSSCGLDNLRSILYFPGYTEGYATYVENYAYQYMDVDPDVAELMRLNGLYVIAVHALMDLEIHYEGWTVDDVAVLLEDEFGITDIDTATEVYHQIIADPANYLKYYIGCAEIMELRSRAEAERGANFSLIDFHDELISFGDAPFSVLEKYLLNERKTSFSIWSLIFPFLYFL